MKQTLLLPLFLVAFGHLATSQQTVTIAQMTVKPDIDGDVNEQAWAEIPEIGGFTTSLPQSGKTPQSPTTVKIGFTDLGIYLSAVCKSPKIRNEGSIRDNKGTGEYFSVGLDTWNDDQNAFVFTVSAAGQITDERLSSTQTEPGFDTPWKAVTHQQDDGWTVEIWIPFRALRYPKKGLQNWGVQFTRFDRSSGETSTWNPQDPLIQDIVLQYGTLEGLEIGAQKDRLGVTNMSTANYRFISAKSKGVYGNDYEYSDGTPSIHTNLDGRYRPTSATTFDFSIIPAIEAGRYDGSNGLRIEERPDLPGIRPLLAEESGLFNKTQKIRHLYGFPASNLLAYTTLPPPVFNFTNNNGHVLNNVKMTTRTANNVGIGIVNTVSDRTDAYFYSAGRFAGENIVTRRFPVTNQISVEKAYRNNTWFQLSNIREFIAKDKFFNIATVAGQWRDKTNNYEVAGKMALETLPANYTRGVGNCSVKKINGAWNWGAVYYSPGQRYNSDFDPAIKITDPLEHLANAFISKRNFNPRPTNWLNTSYGVSMKTNVDDQTKKNVILQFGGYFSALNKHFSRTELFAGFNPVNRQEKFSYNNQVIQRSPPRSTHAGFSWASDERKIFTFAITGTVEKSLGSTEDSYYTYTRLQFVPQKRWVWNASAFFNYQQDQRFPITDLFPDYGVGKTNIQLVVISTGVLYTFSPKWVTGAGVQYYSERQLNRRAHIVDGSGELVPVSYTFTGQTGNELIQPSFFISWYISPLRQIRFTYNDNTNRIPSAGSGTERFRTINYSLMAIISLYK